MVTIACKIAEFHSAPAGRSGVPRICLTTPTPLSTRYRAAPALFGGHPKCYTASGNELVVEIIRVSALGVDYE